MIAYTIEASLKSKFISRTIVSTDCEKIKNISLNHGAEVPFIRPKEISQDMSTSEEGLKHAINWLEKNENYFQILLFICKLQILLEKME